MLSLMCVFVCVGVCVCVCVCTCMCVCVGVFVCVGVCVGVFEGMEHNVEARLGIPCSPETFWNGCLRGLLPQCGQTVHPLWQIINLVSEMYFRKSVCLTRQCISKSISVSLRRPEYLFWPGQARHSLGGNARPAFHAPTIFWNVCLRGLLLQCGQARHSVHCSLNYSLLCVSERKDACLIRPYILVNRINLCVFEKDVASSMARPGIPNSPYFKSLMFV